MRTRSLAALATIRAASPGDAEPMRSVGAPDSRVPPTGSTWARAASGRVAKKRASGHPRATGLPNRDITARLRTSARFNP